MLKKQKKKQRVIFILVWLGYLVFGVTLVWLVDALVDDIGETWVKKTLIGLFTGVCTRIGAEAV